MECLYWIVIAVLGFFAGWGMMDFFFGGER